VRAGRQLKALLGALALALALGGCGTYACPGGTRSATVCTQCGPAGGCARTETQCAKLCAKSDDCGGGGLGCVDGVCQVFGCI
jgi:hypothetical protein